MKMYQVIPYEEGWKVIGSGDEKAFRTKENAVVLGRRIARREGKSLVVHSRDGKISSVISYGRNTEKGKILSANVKRRLSKRKVRNSIAEVIISKKSPSKLNE